MMSREPALPFATIAARANQQAETLLREWFPQGKRRGWEYTVGNLNGEVGESLSINLNNGLWSDFASGERGGDLIALLAARNKISQSEAARQLASRLGIHLSETSSARPTKQKNHAQKPLAFIPEKIQPPPLSSPQGMRLSARWLYRNQKGEGLFYVSRHDPIDKSSPQRKLFQPHILLRQNDGKRAWQRSSYPAPRPLYGLELLQNHAQDLLIVEGEKSCDAARRLLPELLALTWSGGSNAVALSNWQLLQGRTLYLWPDADSAGEKAMHWLANHLHTLQCQIYWVQPPSTAANGWDLADAETEGWSSEQCRQWLTQNSREWQMAPAEEVGEQPAVSEELLAESDLGNARMVVQQHGEDLRYVRQWNRWYVWNGSHWQQDETEEVVRRCKGSILSLLQRVDESVYATEKNARFRFALRSQSRAAIENAICLARNEPQVILRPEELDSDPWLLNCSNGTLSLRDGQLRAHRREDLLSRSLPVVYDAQAEAPLWEKFIDRIMGHDPERVEFLRKAVGYTLSGDTSEQCFFYCFGVGQNGKSTFLEVIFELLGRYARRLPADSLMLRTQGGAISNDIAGLVGARLVASSEVEEGARLHEAKLKEMTGGDTLTARFLHQEYFEFRPVFKLWMLGNYKPVIRGTDQGIWRRIHLIPFGAPIAEAERDRQLPIKLRQEMPGILRWAVEGCLSWQREGLQQPLAVREATQAYRSESDIIGQFLEEHTVFDTHAEVQASFIYERYTHWTNVNGHRACSSTQFTRKLTDRGLLTRRSNGTWIVGLRLATHRHLDSNFEVSGGKSASVSNLKNSVEVSRCPDYRIEDESWGV
ncbi:phage/plasmid primase, P4 family [Candidatus Magnetaquicoccus inordinatus]|uniref:phage/plasmid primase, P4 family n=1 Tax=Candidatus Magnetaquicoccus inordinatus TaxID=2496818 RepID=UPI00187D102C|nr:phage/plasmid primase, P4 family [Candidatus Magnetaquicoccus inordinatus]